MTINEKLIQIQAELKAPKDKTNNFGGYKYRSCESILEAVKPLLKTVGCTLTISDSIAETGGRIYVMARAELSDGESSVITTAFAREPESKKGMDEPQITGTASSYARKYALNGFFAIYETQDAEKQTAQPKEKQQAQPKALICADCGGEITQVVEGGSQFSARAVAEKTRKRFGRCLCWNCASKA